MAITRRQFVTRLGALAATVGFSQADVSQLAGAFAGNATDFGGNFNKPRVIWIHGAECTGCSVGLLGILESPDGKPIYGDKTTTVVDALGLAGVTGNASAHLLPGSQNPHFTMWDAPVPVTMPLGKNVVEGKPLVNIADVVIDVVDLQYHETIMGMGGDLAAQWLRDFVLDPGAAGTTGALPFVLVVEGALQDKLSGGAWNDTSDTDVSWCSIAASDDFEGAVGFDIDMPSTVVALAKKASCVAVIPIGQCASFGGYPGCKPNVSAADAGQFNPKVSQTDAMGVHAYLTKDALDTAAVAAANKVINVPGCPTNPWWFVLTVVLFMADFRNPGLIASLGGLDTSRRIKAVYPVPVHTSWCPRNGAYNKGIFALKPGDPGCLQKIGCKGISARSSCGIHGWNNQQPQNPGSLASLNNGGGGHCTRAGHPCMACTEKGYPDAFVPYVKI